MDWRPFWRRDIARGVSVDYLGRYVAFGPAELRLRCSLGRSLWRVGRADGGKWGNIGSYWQSKDIDNRITRNYSSLCYCGAVP